MAETKLENLSHRLTRLENQIDKLQAAILEKVGSYGRGLDLVKREMEMVENSFGKLASGLHGTSHHQASGGKGKSVTISKTKKHTKKTSKK